MTKERALKLREMILKASASLPDEDALEAVELFPYWATGTAYEQGKRIRYGESCTAVYRSTLRKTAGSRTRPRPSGRKWQSPVKSPCGGSRQERRTPT